MAGNRDVRYRGSLLNAALFSWKVRYAASVELRSWRSERLELSRPWRSVRVFVTSMDDVLLSMSMFDTDILWNRVSYATELRV